MSGRRRRCGGKHRYSHKVCNNKNQHKNGTVEENFCNKHITFQSSFEDSPSDNFGDKSYKDLDVVAYNLENLELQAEGFSQVTGKNKFIDDWRDRNKSSSIEVSSDSSFELSSNSWSCSIEDEIELSSSHVLEEYEASTSNEDERSNSSDSLNSDIVENMSEAEALDYIQHLKKKIEKIERVLQVRRGSSSLNSPEHNSKSPRNVGSSTGFEELTADAEEKTGKRHRKPKKTSESSKRNSALLDKSSQSNSKSSRLYSKMLDDEFNFAMSQTSSKKPQRRKQSNTHQKGKRASVLRIFQRIRTFLLTESTKSYTFQALSRYLRFAVHKYAEACGIPSHSRGKEGKRVITITRRSHWTIPSEETVESILEDIGLGSDKNRKKIKRSQKGGSKRVAASVAPATTYSARGRKELEKSLAVTITEDNIGHRYLQMGSNNLSLLSFARILQTMGWSRGQSLGHPDREEVGLTRPLPVRIRPPRAGLGSHEEGL